MVGLPLNRLIDRYTELQTLPSQIFVWFGNFPNNHSNQQNQSSSTGSGRMNLATAVPQLDAEFFNERGLPKIYNLPPAPQIGSMNILKKIPQNDAILISKRGEEIQLIK